MYIHQIDITTNVTIPLAKVETENPYARALTVHSTKNVCTYNKMYKNIKTLQH